jgi:hypothetical protein
MSILNVNQIQPVGGGNTITVSASDVSASGATITASSFVGPISGNTTGDLTGNVTGDLTGNVTGDLTGNVTGDLTGNVTGNVTGNLTGTASTATASATAYSLTGSPSITVTDITATGNVSIAGTLTYEDVTNVDSVGIITAQSGIKASGESTFNGNVGIQTSDISNSDLVGAGNSFVGMYIGDGFLAFSTSLSRPDGYYISTSINALNAGPVTLGSTMTLDGTWVIV